MAGWVAALAIVSSAFGAPAFKQLPQSNPVTLGGFGGFSAVVSGSGSVSYNILKGSTSVKSGTAACVSDWKTAAAGAAHTLAIKQDGSLWAWGDNSSGQLGGSYPPSSSNYPIRVGTGTTWKSVSARGGMSAGIKTDGTFWIWGSGFTATPTQVGSGTTWASASLGDVSALLLTTGGALYEMLYSTKLPAQMGTDSDWASVSAGFMMMSAIKTDGTLWNRPLNTNSTWSTFAGQSQVSGGINATGTAATFNYFTAMTSESGTLYVGDSNGIRKITSSGVVTTLTGTLTYPNAITVYSGTVFAASGNAVKKITPAGAVSTLAGSDNWWETGITDGQGTIARFNQPSGIVATAGGTLYVADTNNHTIRKITPAGLVSTVAGVVGASGTSDGASSVAKLNAPRDLCCDSSGNLYFIDSNSRTLRKLSSSGQVSTLAGDSLSQSWSGVDGLGTAGSFGYNLRGLTVDGSGNLYLGDYNRIRKVTSLGQVTTLAGAGGYDWEQGSVNGSGDIAKFRSVTGLTLVSGSLYVADSSDYTVRKGVLSTPLVNDAAHGGFVKIGGTAQFSKVSAGNGYAMALKTDGSVYAWGQVNSSYWPNLFINSGSYHTVPVQLGADVSGYNDIAAGGLALATTTTGQVRRVTESSGDNYTINTPSTAGSTAVAWSSLSAPSYLVTDSATVLGPDGILWSWGRNDVGQLGNYTQVDLNSYYWYQTPGDSFYEPFQVGIDPAWGLRSPVQGIPLGASTSNASGADLGPSTLNVTDTSGTISAPFVLVAWPEPPTPARTVAGGSFSLSAAANAGIGNAVTYQWLRNGSVVLGATQSVFSVTNATSSQSGVYQARVSIGAAQALSDPVVVTVDSPNVALARDALAAGNYAFASSYLAAAISNSTADGTAQLLRSALDLYNLWSDPTTAAALANLGFSGSPDPRNFTLTFSDAGFPSGAVSSSARNWLITTLYPKLKAADDNLATITDTAFITTIRAADLGLGGQGNDVYVDYGDVVAMRAAINTAMACAKWIETQNTDVDLFGLQMDRRNGRLSMEYLLSTTNKYASLLTASTTSTAAQTEFVSRFKNALTQYQSFSNFANPATVSSSTRRYNDLCATKLETTQDIKDEKTFRLAVDQTQASLNAANDVAGRQVYTVGDANPITISPRVFFNHAPGWRSDLPKFTKNTYSSGLNRTLLTNFMPTLSVSDLDGVEADLVNAEPKITAELLTRADATPPELDLSGAPASLTTTDGWLKVEGLVRDASGVKNVTLSATFGSVVDSYDATLDSGTLAGGWRKWTAYVAIPSGFSGTSLSVGVNAEDVYGGITETTSTRSYDLTRLVPFSLLSSGSGTVTCSPEPDENGFVPLGSRITITAKAATGSMVRRIETVIDGQPQTLPTVRSSTVAVSIRGETSVSVVFEPNPYSVVGGRNKSAYSLLEAESAVTGSSVDGVFPLSSLQVSITALGSFSGRLIIGRAAYSVSGRFDADGFYSAPLAGRIPCLNWGPVYANSNYGMNRLPTCAILPMLLQMWVDTTAGLDSPTLRVSLADGFGTSLGGTLTAMGNLNYTGSPLYTGTFSKNNSTPTTGTNGGWISYGLPSNSGAINTGSVAGSGGFYSIAARKTGSATVLGMLPNGEKFTSATWLLDQFESSARSAATVRLITPVGTNGAFGFIADLSTPFSYYSSTTTNSWARREAWYPGNRGPVFETGSVYSYSAGGSYVQTAIPVFAREWSLRATPFEPTTSGTVQVSLSPAGSGSSLSPAFTVSSDAGKVSVGDVNSATLQSVQLSLSLATGVMTGSVQLPTGKRLLLQGVFIQPATAGMSGQMGGVWATSDGRRFVSQYNNPLMNYMDSW